MINAYERLNIYIEDYKLNSHNGLDRMKNYYDCEDEYWWVIEQLLDKYIDVDDKNKKAIEILGQYKHLSSPTEEQANEQEEIVSTAYDILKDDK